MSSIAGGKLLLWQEVERNASEMRQGAVFEEVQRQIIRQDAKGSQSGNHQCFALASVERSGQRALLEDFLRAGC